MTSTFIFKLPAYHPLTLHSMRLALSLLAFSALAAANENIDGKWYSATQISDGNNDLLTSEVQHITLSDNQKNPYLCVTDVSSLCQKISSSGSTYLFGVTGCAVPKAEGACVEPMKHDTCSSFLVQIGTPTNTIKHVSPNDILPNMCDTQANLVNRTLLYWMYLLLWGSLMRNVMSKFVLLIVNTLTSCCFR